MNDFHRDLRRSIDRHGWYVPSVLGDRPEAPVWTYTVGLQENGLPELIVFGEPPQHAYAILDAVRHMLLERPDRARAGEHLGELPTSDGPRPCRLGPVHRRWVREFPLWASELYGPTVPVLQIVRADDLGAFWDDAAYDPAVGWDHVQPDLSNPTRPWRSPMWAYSWLADEVEPDLWVLVPITIDDVPEHRDEAVPAVRLSDTTARLLQPPILADHVTADAVVAVEPQPAGVLTASWPRTTAPTHSLVSVQDRGHRVHLAYQMAPHDDWTTGGIEAVCEQIERHGAACALGVGTINLALPNRSAERARISFRRFERDGLLTALPSYHAPPAYADHPGCPTCNRSRP